MKDIPCPACHTPYAVHADIDAGVYRCRECGTEWESLIAVAHHMPDPQRNLEEFSSTSSGDLQ